MWFQCCDRGLPKHAKCLHRGDKFFTRRIGHGKHSADAILFILHYSTWPHRFDGRVSKCQKSHASASICASSSSAARSSSPNPFRSAQSMSMIATTYPPSAYHNPEQNKTTQNDKELCFLPFRASQSVPQSRSCSRRRMQCARGTCQHPEPPA